MAKSPKSIPAGSLAAAGLEGSADRNLGRRQRKARETRIRLFRAALQLFADRGFQNVTVEDITEAADVGKGTFFNYFESKEHVLGVMAELQLAHVGEAVQAAGQSKKGSIRTILHHLFLQLSREVGRSPAFARTIVASFLASEVVRGVVQLRMSEGRKAVAGLFALGQERGEITKAFPVVHLAEFMEALYHTVVRQWTVDLTGPHKLSERVDSAVEFFLRGLKP